MRHIVGLSCFAALVWLAPVTVAGQATIDTLVMKAHTYFLSHDLLRGRATGTTEADVAAIYIAAQCRAMGLLPINEGLLLPVPLEEATVGGRTRVTLAYRGQRLTFRYPQDFTPNVGTRATLTSFEGPAFYLGPANGLDSLAIDSLDLEGAVAVTLGPRTTLDALTSLVEAGVVGIVHLLADPAAYDLYARSRGRTRLFHSDATVRSSFLPPLPSVLAGPHLSYALVSGTPLRLEGAAGPGPLDRVMSFTIESTSRSFAGHNVACLMQGADPAVRDTVITFTAHYDHLGVGVPDSSGDAIYNGFSDNAAGVSMLLAIAKAAVENRTSPMRHSVLFLFFIAEERGLLGSDYYVANPAWPLGSTRAVINLDAGAPPGQPTSWRLAGVDSSGLGALAIEVAASRGWRVTTSPATPNSDYYPFVREGVPGLFIIPGPGSYEGLSPDSSEALKARWDHYHRPSDHWHEEYPFAGLARYAEFGLLIARALDRLHQRP